MSLSQKMVSSVLWEFLQQISRRGIGVLVTLLLARFLSPADYGLIAMMAVFIAIATSLMNSGFKQALIRLKGATQVDFNTAFYANLCLGITSYLLLFMAAPFIAVFYEESRLTLLIRVLGLNIIVHSFQVVQSAILNREMNFKAQFVAVIPAVIISGLIAIGMAFAGLGVWALIAQMLLADLITTVLLWSIQDWRPTASFSLKILGKMYNFGYKLFISGLIDTIYNNLYVIVIAKIFSAPVAGFYFFSNKLKEMLVHQLIGSIQTVAYPTLARLQNDDQAIKNGCRKIIQVSTFIMFPAMLFLAAVANPMFSVLLSDKWMPAVPFFQLLCISSILAPLHAINLNILQVKGRSDLFLFLGVFNKIFAGMILYISLNYGITGILIGQIVISVITYVPNSFFTARLINYPIYEQIIDFSPCLILSLGLGLMIFCADFSLQWPVFAKLIFLFSLATVGYFAVAHLLKLKSYVITIHIISERIKSNRSMAK